MNTLLLLESSSLYGALRLLLPLLVRRGTNHGVIQEDARDRALAFAGFGTVSAAGTATLVHEKTIALMAGLPPLTATAQSLNERRLVLILCDRNGKLFEIRHVNSLG